MQNKKINHFIDIKYFEKDQLRSIIDNAKHLKNLDISSQSSLLQNKILAMIFEKTSTRTRISFEVAIKHLGGSSLVMNKNDTHLGKSETIADTAKVMSRMVDAVMIRCYDHDTLFDFARNSTIPVINGLSNYSHPCQIMASIMSIEEKLGNISNLTLAWFGDANNVLNSYIQAAAIFGFELRIAKPGHYNFSDPDIIDAINNKAKIIVDEDPKYIAKNADVIITDTWFSMGDDSEKNQEAKQKKFNELMPYQVNERLFEITKSNAIFTHCLPLYRDYEVTANIADGSRSIIFDEAENRLHIQKAILQFCLK